MLTRDANFTVDVYFIVAGFVGELGSKSQHSWKFSECRKVLLKKFIRLAPIYYTCTLLWLALHYYSVPCHVHAHGGAPFVHGPGVARLRRSGEGPVAPPFRGVPF